MSSDPGPTLDSVYLRALAEGASSLRGPADEPCFLVTTRRNGRLKTRVEKKRPPADPQAVVIPLDTPFVQPRRPPVEAVSIRAKGMKEPVSLDRYDAVFWSESAVEKFVFPYYASKTEWNAAHVLAALSTAFYGYVPVTPGEGAGERVEATEETIPFAVGHLPRSDYEMVDETSIAQALHLLFRDADGRVTHRPLADYL